MKMWLLVTAFLVAAFWAAFFWFSTQNRLLEDNLEYLNGILNDPKFNEQCDDAIAAGNSFDDVYLEWLRNVLTEEMILGMDCISPEVLDELVSCIPGGVELSSVAVLKGEISFAAKTESSAVAIEMERNLRSSGYYSSVFMQYLEASADEPESDVVDSSCNVKVVVERKGVGI